MFRAGQSLNGLEIIKEPILPQNINDICAVCLRQHENNRTSTMQDMLSAQNKIEIYKILESISLFKYSAKTPQLLCSTCSFKLINIYEFQQMCNKSYFHIYNYINQKDTQDIFKLEIEDKGDVETITENEQFIEEVGDNNFPLNWVENEQKSDRIGVISKSPTLADEASISTKILNTPTMIVPLTNTEKEHFIFRIEDAEDDTCKFEIEDTEIHDLDSDSEGSIKSMQESQCSYYLKEHTKIHTTELFCCEICEKPFKEEQALTSHMVTHIKLHYNDAEKFSKESEQTTKVSSVSDIVGADAIAGDGITNERNRIDHQPGSAAELTERGAHSKDHLSLDKKESCIDARKGTTTELVCKYCNTTFTDKYKLKAHMDAYEELQNMMCAFCGIVLKNKHGLIIHERMHTEEKQFKCIQCPKMFGSRGFLEFHEITHPKEWPFFCDKCNKKFEDKYSLTLHAATHFNNDVTYKRRINMSPVSEIVQAKLLETDGIPNNRNSESLNTPVPRIERKANMSVKITKHDAHPKRDLSLDKNQNCNTKKRTAIKEYVCKYCSKVFSYKSQLRMHLDIHENVRHFMCAFCGSRFACKSKLIVHERMHTGEKPFKCNQCEKSFASRLSLKYHKITHTTKRPFCCEVCAKTFKGKRTLTLHMQTHTNPLSHVCRICSKAYNLKSSLLNHMYKHINGGCDVAPESRAQRPYKCQQCEKFFSSARFLESHSAVHSEERRYACKLCDKKYKESKTLKRHMVKHSGLRPFVCSICNKDFDRKSTLNIHMRTQLHLRK